MGIIAGLIAGLLIFCIQEHLDHRKTVDWELRQIIKHQTKKMDEEESWL